MTLDFFQKIRDIFENIFTEFSLSSLFTLLLGVVLGIILCFSGYVYVLFSTSKTEEKQIATSIPDVDNERIIKMIRSAKNEYIEESSFLNTSQKLVNVKNISWDLIHSIAHAYYPESNYPIYELSLDELMTLSHYITNRIDSIFTGPILKKLKKVKLSQILKLLDLKKKIDENKVMKTANKFKFPKIISSVTAVLNVFNPVYWVRKLMINTTLVAVTNKIALTIIDVVGEETNKVYSKNVFNIEKEANAEIETAINEIENMIKEDKE